MQAWRQPVIQNCSFVGGEACTETTSCPRVPMESRNAKCKAIHAAVQRGSEQMRHNGVRCSGIDQGAARSDIVLSEVLSRGHLRMLRDEHRRCQYLGLHNVTIVVLKFCQHTLDIIEILKIIWIYDSSLGNLMITISSVI